MTGGKGKDTFVFGKASGIDRITDFERGDKIDLSGIGASFDELAIQMDAEGISVTRFDQENSVIILDDASWESIREDTFIF